MSAMDELNPGLKCLGAYEDGLRPAAQLSGGAADARSGRLMTVTQLVATF
jgi:hypothetical protein